MGLFDRFRRRRPRDIPGVRGRSSETVAELREFMATREGVEGFLEPQTAIYATTVLLVAGDGEYLRRPVRDERDARRLCEDHGVPLYEARKVGYPQRMRDYERGIRSARIRLEDLPPLTTTDEHGGE